MRALVAIPIAAILPACWMSHAIGSDPAGADSGTDAPDAWVDPGADPDAAGDPDLPDPSCTLEPRGARQLTSGGHAASAPRVYWDGDEVGVVFMEGGGDMWHPQVSMIRVMPDLSDQSALVVVGEESHGWGEPAWTGDSLGICWHTDPGMVGRTAFRMHSASGAILGSRVDLDFSGEACLGLLHREGSFLSSWRSFPDPGSSGTATMIAVLGPGGSTISGPVEIARGEYPGPTPTLLGVPGGYLVVWARSGIVTGRWLDPSGAVLHESSVEVAAATYCSAGMRDGLIGLACTIAGGDASSVAFLEVGDGMEILAGPVTLSSYEPETGGPDIVGLPDGWAVSWHQGDWTDQRAYLAHVDEGGDRRQPDLVLREGRNSGYGGPVLMARGDDLYAGISAYPEPDAGLEQAYLMRFECVP